MSLAPARERLKSRLVELQIEPKRSLGQNFLVSDSAIERIVAAAFVFQPRIILEIGPGLGALTDPLRIAAPEYVALELDRVFAEYWRLQGVNVIEGDALHFDWQRLPFEGPVLLVSNLPYQISSRLVIDRSQDPQPLAGMVLMFQKEVAQRMRAGIGVSEYGFLSVVAQTFWDVSFLLECGPRDFYPPPKVASRVLVFNPRQSVIADRRLFVRFAKSCFLHPRKKMVSNLIEAFPLNRVLLLEVYEKLRLNENVRAQELRLTQFSELFFELEGHLKRKTSNGGS